MATKIENLAKTLELIRANPEAAQREAKNWQEFVLKLSSSYPEIQIIDSQEEFSAWAEAHPQLNIDRTVFKGKEIIEAYFYLREQQEVKNTPPPPTDLMPTMDALNVMSFPVLAVILRDTPKTLEADSDYQKILTSKKNEWQTKNNVLDIYQSEEGLNYLYGDPNDPNKKTIEDETEEKFRELAKTNKGMAKRLEKYDSLKEKIYKKPQDDPSLMHFFGKINEEKRDRFLLLEKRGEKVSEEELKKLSQQIEEKHYLKYALKYQKKAEAYSLVNEDLKKALEKIPRKIVQEEKEEEEKKKQVSGQVRRLVEELQKEQKTAEISNIRRPMPSQRPPVSQSPMTKPTAPGFTQRPSMPKVNLGGLGRGVGQGFGRAGGAMGQGAMRGATALGSAGIGALLPWILGALAFLLLIVIIVLIFGGGMAEIPSEEGGPGGVVSGCTFYRGGDKEPGMKFGNPQMAALVSEISGKVGVPSSIIAGIMRVETPSAVSSTDPTYLTNDYDMHCSIEGWKENRPPNLEECKQRGVAFGVMQFTPNTFLGIYQVNGVDIRSIFGKTDLKTTLDPQDNMVPENIFRIYSIKDSITAAAYKVKNDKYYINKDGPWDEATVREIAYRYYGTKKDYDDKGNNYGTDLWKSFQNCQPSQSEPVPGYDLNATVSCPLSSRKDWVIGCGSFMSDERFNRLACLGPLPIDRGHCGRKYDPKGTLCYKGDIEATKAQRWAQAIDVDAPAGETVFAPRINNQNVRWNLVEGSSYSVPDSMGGGWGHAFVSTVSADKWMMYTVHMNYQVIPPPLGKGHYDSGDPITTVARADYTHLHLNLGKQIADSNIVWLPPEGLGACVN